jgi:hypothetical protein
MILSTPKIGRSGQSRLDRPTNPVRPPCPMSSEDNLDFPVGQLLLSRSVTIYRTSISEFGREIRLLKDLHVTHAVRPRGSSG